MKNYVIGLDAGATKSHLALFDSDGEMIDFRRHTTLSHEALTGSYSQLEDELKEFITNTLATNGVEISQISYAVFGMAGVDTKKEHGIISDIIRRIGLNEFMLCNDAYLGVFAAAPDCVGVCAINGTGASIAGINRSGEMMQIGGLGALTNDMGGGTYMGALAVGAVYSALFREAEPTLLTDPVLSALGVSHKNNFMEAVNERLISGGLNTGMFNRMLFEAAGQGDKPASEILNAVAKNYSGGITGIIKELGFNSLTVVLAGSVFVRGEHPILVDTLKKNLAAANPLVGIDYVILQTPPVAGAIVKALETRGRNLREKVCHQLANLV